MPIAGFLLFSVAEVRMQFAFRVDSSPQIGMGHLMRCLTLARGLRRRGFECSFICRDFEGNGSHHVTNDDFELHLLSIDEHELDETWLGVAPLTDFTETAHILSQNQPDWLIIDHYEIDHEWETEVRSKFPDLKIMVIDDLVNRKHDCDILLDQTYGRTPREYSDLVPKSSGFCLGTDFALLRAEFSKLREQARQDTKQDKDSCHILVTLGGGDTGHALKIIGGAFKELAKDHLFSATVITGNTAKELLSEFDMPTHDIECRDFSDDLAGEMMKSDIVIGAGGGTSWERCCLGLPTVVLTMADNQIEIARILHEKNAAISVNTVIDEITIAVNSLISDPSLRSVMSQNAAELCDGRGVVRVIRNILLSSFKIEIATLDDAQFIYDARYADGAAQYYRSNSIPEFEGHVAWLKNALADDDRLLVCVSMGGEKIAHIRLDKNPGMQDRGEIGICLDKNWRGRGIGRAILDAGNEYFAALGIFKIDAEVHENNNASAQVFEQAGYEHVLTDNDGFMRYLWQQ